VAGPRLGNVTDDHWTGTEARAPELRTATGCHSTWRYSARRERTSRTTHPS